MSRNRIDWLTLETRIRGVLRSPEAISRPHEALARIDAIVANVTGRGDCRFDEWSDYMPEDRRSEIFDSEDPA